MRRRPYFPNRFSYSVLAFQASHGLPLVFLREKPENEGLGFRLGLATKHQILGVTGGDWTLASRLQIECSTGLSYGHHIGAHAHHTCPETFLLPSKLQIRRQWGQSPTPDVSVLIIVAYFT
jgi:hypothetical protein